MKQIIKIFAQYRKLFDFLHPVKIFGFSRTQSQEHQSVPWGGSKKLRGYSRAFLLVLIVATFSSCDWLMDVYGIRKRRPKSSSEESKQLVEEIKTTDLAKIIIKPSPKVLKVQRDPFKPLISRKRKNLSGTQDDQADEDVLEDVKFLGVVKIGDSFSALLRTNEAKGAFNIGEKVGAYTISEITQEEVTFTKEDKTYKK